MTTSVIIIIIVISLLLSAFFSGMEIAYVSSNKIHIELEKKQEGFLANILAKLTAKPSKFIATMLIGNNIALVIYGFFMGDLLLSWFQTFETSKIPILNYLINDLSLLSQTIISTLIILFTAEFLPKVFFQIYANSLLKILAFPAYLFYVLFSFISDFVIWISDLVLKKFFKTEADQIQLAFTKVELGHYISEQMESVEAHDEVDSEIQIFQNALDFSDLKAREVMVPRTELMAVELNETVESLKRLFINTGFSKILVYKESIDDILGYIHLFELFKNKQNIGAMLLPVELVPETMYAKDILGVLSKKRRSIAVVVDEYGGTSGIITVEDIVEELLGEIEDEHDNVDFVENSLGKDVFQFSARLEVDYLNETYKFNMPEEEHYETLGGLIVSHNEEIPVKGDVIIVSHFKFTILEASNNKIDLVEMKVLDLY
jgi:CBS domain containing-hemolysin-like protein